MNLKRITAFVCAIAAGVSVTSFAAETPEPNTNMLILEGGEAKPGETVRVYIMFENFAEGQHFNTMQLRFMIPEGLKYVKSTKGMMCGVNDDSITFIASSGVYELEMAKEIYAFADLKIPEDAVPGTSYELKWADTNDYKFMLSYVDFDEGEIEVDVGCNFVNGVINIVDNKKTGKTDHEIFYENPVSASDSSEISISVSDSITFSSENSRKAGFSFSFADSETDNSYFDYSALALSLPEGFSVDSVNLNGALSDNPDISLRYVTPGSDECSTIDSQAGSKSQDGYIVVSGTGLRDVCSTPDLFELILNTPDMSEYSESKIAFNALFGVYTGDPEVSEDGTMRQYVSFIEGNDSGKIYDSIETGCIKGVKGDVNLDGQVSQLDATAVLKETLSVSVTGRSVLKGLINTEASVDNPVKLSYYLGDVDLSDNGDRFAQLDATSIMKAVLAADVAGEKYITEEIWNRVLSDNNENK